MSTPDETGEDEVIARDDQMPQLISQASRNHLEEEQDDVITNKSPRASDTQEDTSGESTAAEEIKSDEDEVATENASPQYTSPSEDSEVEYVKTTKGNGNISELDGSKTEQSQKIQTTKVWATMARGCPRGPELTKLCVVRFFPNLWLEF